MSERLLLRDIRVDGGTQPRAALNQALITEYMGDMERGAEFPPVTVFYDGENYWLADGFHRYHARAAHGPDRYLEAEVRQGTKRDAVLFSLGANSSHGARRTNEDKRRAVRCMLEDPEWSQWSDHEIAQRCGVSQPFVSQLRAKASEPVSDNDYKIDAARTVKRGGSTYTMDTARIGRAEPKETHRPEQPRADVGHEARTHDRPERSKTSLELELLATFERVLELGRELPGHMHFETMEDVARRLTATLGLNAPRDVRHLRASLHDLDDHLERLVRPPEGIAVADGLVTGPRTRPEPGPDPRKLCPDLVHCLWRAVELPYPAGRERGGGGLFMNWPWVTGDDLVAGILLLDYQAYRRGGLGPGKLRLRWALNEMLRRYRRAGGTGVERVGVVLARAALEGVAEPPSSAQPVLELAAEPPGEARP